MALAVFNRRDFFRASAIYAAGVAAANIPFVRNSFGTEDRNTWYEVTEAVTDPNRITDSSIQAYYKINTSKVFQVNLYSDGKLGPAYYQEDFDNDKLFPKILSSEPVAIIDTGRAGLPGVFEVYYVSNKTGNQYHYNCEHYKDGAYCIHYKNDVKSRFISPIINVPSHTRVEARLLLQIDQTTKEIPQGFVSALQRRGCEMYLAGKVEDSLYHLFPSWMEEDRKKPNDPSKPWLEIKPDGTCIDRRNNSNTSACYTRKKTIINQKWYEYGSRQIRDRTDDTTWTRHTVGHELGHAIAAINADDHYDGDSWRYSSFKLGSGEKFDDSDAFTQAFEKDLSRMPTEVKKELGYLTCKRQKHTAEGEAFADIFSSFVGTEPAKHAAAVLQAFPHSSEYVRDKVFPLFGVNLPVEAVREKIYSKYLLDVQLTSAEKCELGRTIAQILWDQRNGSDSLYAEGSCCG